MKKATIVAALIICIPYSVFAVPFDAIVPLNALVGSSASPVDIPMWGWIVATAPTTPISISSMDLMNASFMASISDPMVTVSIQSFTSFPDLQQGQVAGLLSSPANDPAYPSLLAGNETLVNPTQGFWFIRFGGFPDGHTSTATLTGSVMIGSDVVNYTSTLMFGSSTSFFEVTQGQRLSSTPVSPAIPEPGTLLLIGSGLVGLGVGAWRRKKP